VTGGGTFNSGASISLAAVPNTGYAFVNWTENGTVVITTPSYTLSASGNRTLIANFVATYTIAATSSPIGAGAVTGGGTFNSGAGITVEATAALGYAFVNWTENGTIVSTTPSYSFSAVTDRSLIANFVPTYTIVATTSPLAGGGTIGQGIFKSGTNVTLTAIPNSGYAFINWTESTAVVSTSSTYSFTATGDRTLVAHFTPTFTINATAAPVDSGTTSGQGTFNSGTTVALFATASPGFSFVNWTENGNEVSTAASYSFSAVADRSLTANFVATSAISVTTSPLAGGMTSGAGIFNAGASVTLTAMANPGYAFLNWTENGSVVGTLQSYSFTVVSNRALVANFVPTYSIGATVSPQVAGTTSGFGTFNSGDTVTLIATPAAGYSFVNWTDNGVVVGTDANYSFTAIGDRTLVANFSRELAPSMTFMRTDTNTIVLSWTAASTGYVVWESPAPESGNWTLSTNEITANGLLRKVIIPVARESRFYRLSSR
jgi:hypothetical protein